MVANIRKMLPGIRSSISYMSWEPILYGQRWEKEVSHMGWAPILYMHRWEKRFSIPGEKNGILYPVCKKGKSVTRVHCWASLGKPRNAQQWPSWQTFLGKPHTHERYLYCWVFKTNYFYSLKNARKSKKKERKKHETKTLKKFKGAANIFPCTLV